MSIALPDPIAAYFDADRGSDAAQCFAEHATVKDEGAGARDDVQSQVRDSAATVKDTSTS